MLCLAKLNCFDRSYHQDMQSVKYKSGFGHLNIHEICCVFSGGVVGWCGWRGCSAVLVFMVAKHVQETHVER